MPVRYKIIENKLKPGAYYARVVDGRRVELDEMIGRVVAKTALSAADMHGAVLALNEEIIAVLAAGDVAVIDGLGTFRLSLSGSFDSPEAIVTRENARPNIVIQRDKSMLSAVLALAEYAKTVAAVKSPVISRFYDVATRAFDCYTPGSVVRLKGKHLKFDPAQADQGVFVSDGLTETRLTLYSEITNRRIDILLPPDLHGPLTFIVRTRYAPGGELRASRHHRTVNPA
jgi:predicted histone-like DNA-binding protein